MFDLSKRQQSQPRQQPQPQYNQSYAPAPQGVGPLISSLPSLREQQQPSFPQLDSMYKFPASHTVYNPQPIAQNNWFNQLKAFDFKGLTNDIHPTQILNNIGNGLSHGLSKTGTYTGNAGMANILSHNTLPYMANIGNQQLASQQQHNDYLKANPVNSIAGQLGEQIPQIPLWMAGEGVANALGKGISKLAPGIVPTAERLTSRLPNVVQGGINAVKGGLKDVAAYGTVVAPVENYKEGGNLQSLIQKEKSNIPSILIGGTALRGAGALLGKGISKVGSTIAERRPIAPIDLSANPLAHTETPIPTQEPLVAPSIIRNSIAGQSPNNTILAQHVAPGEANLSRMQVKPSEVIPGSPIIRDTPLKQAELPTKPKTELKYSDNPEIINQKQWYHGTGTTELKAQDLSPTNTKTEGLFGQGIYLTDNPEIAKGYAGSRGKRTKTPTVYNTSVKIDKVLDLQKPLESDAFQSIRKTADQISNNFDEPSILKSVDELHAKGVSGADIWKDLSNRMSELSHDQGISKHEFDDYFNDLTINLKENGYDAYTHVGGKITGKDPHQVLILLDPNDHLTRTGRTSQITSFEPQKPAVIPGTEISKPIETAPTYYPLANDTVFWDKVKNEAGWTGDTKSLQDGIKSGAVDTSKLSMAMDLQKFAGPTPPTSLRSTLPTTEPGIKAETPPAQTTPNKYVDTKPIDITIGKNDKVTATDARQGYVGKMNAQIVTGNQLSDTMKALAPKEQEGIQLFIDAGGDMKYLQEMAKYDDPKLDVKIPGTKMTYRDAYNQSLNLSPEAQKAAEMAQTYYKESGQYAMQTGSTKSILEDYANRIWKQDPSGTVKTETRTPGLNPYTSHSKGRIFDSLGDGILEGKTPATLNAGELLSIHNQEMARANTNRELATSLKDNGLGNYQVSKPSEGFTAIDSMSKEVPVVLKDGTASIVRQNFVIPDGIAKGLRSITDPNYMAKVDAFRHLQAYQGLVKTVDLSFSLFHHITLAAQALYNSHGGVDFVRNWDKMSKLGSDTFNASEKWGAEHGLMTTKIDSNYDILRQISGNKVDGKLSEQPGIMKKAEWTANKLGNLPVIKQAGQLADMNTNFLFGKIQRWLKVSDFQNKANAFVGKNPNMQNAEVTKGLRQIASEVNDAYGGLNWKAIGVTPSMQALSRLGLLAPDWTFSSARILAKTFTKGPGGAASRAQFTGGIIGAGILTEGLNKLLTGHYTDQNAKGHELEVEVQPGVYISMFRSGIGDTTKLFANVVNNGLLSGTVGTLQGKMSPLARTVVGQLSNKQPTGAPITSAKNTPLQNDLARLGSFGSSFLPIPMGIPSMKRYIDSGTATPLGSAFVSTGAARYSKTVDINTLANPTSFNSGNWINKLNPSAGPQLKQTKKKIK